MRSPLLALCLALAVPSLALPTRLSVGTCKKEITPISPATAAAYQAAFGVAGVLNHTNPIYMAGFGNNRQATGYNDRLWARGVVLDSKDDRDRDRLGRPDRVLQERDRHDPRRWSRRARTSTSWWSRARTSTRGRTRSESGGASDAAPASTTAISTS